MRNDWHKLFESFFDEIDSEQIKNNDSNQIEQIEDNRDYQYLMVLKFDCIEDGTPKILNSVKKTTELIDMVLELSSFIESYSDIKVYSNYIYQTSSSHSIINYTDNRWFDDGLNFAFYFNVKRENVLKFLQFLYTLWNRALLYRMYLQKLFVYNGSEKDISNIKYSDINEIDNFKQSLQDMRNNLKLDQSDISIIFELCYTISKGIKPAHDLFAKYPNVEKALQVSTNDKILTTCRQNYADYSETKFIAVSANKIIKKICSKEVDMIELAKMAIDNSLQMRILLNNINKLARKTEIYANELGQFDYMTEVLQNKTVFKPIGVQFKQYDNNTRMVCIIDFGLVWVEKYDHRFPRTFILYITGPLYVDNGVIESREEWKTALAFFGISEKEFSEFFGKLKKSAW